MGVKKFSKGEAIKFGWDTMKKNLGFFIGVLIIIFLIFLPFNIISKQTQKDAPVIYIVVQIISYLLNLVISMGLIKISLKLCDNEKVKLGDLFSSVKFFFEYLISSILYTLIIIGGTILLIVPGIIWAIKYQFYGYFIIEKGLSPVEALKKSSAITKGAKWDLFIFNLLLILINLAGLLAMLVGLFATIPTAIMATVFVYRKLLSQIEGA